MPATVGMPASPSERDLAPSQKVSFLSAGDKEAPPPSSSHAADASSPPTNMLVAFARSTWASCRPWPDFFSTRLLQLPSFSSLSDRVFSNLHIFRHNYIVVAAAWAGVSVLSSVPSVLIAGGCGILLSRMATRRAAKNGGVLADKDRMKIGALSLLAVWVSGIYNVLAGALFWAGVSVGAHCALRVESTTPIVEEDV